MDALSRPQPSVDVIVCAYSADRWDTLVRAIDSVLRQTRPIGKCLVIIDHNPALFERATAKLTSRLVSVVANDREKGLAGARNCGLHYAEAEVVAFMDDDAWAEPGWLEALITQFLRPEVVGVGGAVIAEWTVAPPRWFPAEFGWVIGCGYAGLPTAPQPIRNPIGANMAFRRSALDDVGGFHPGVGRTARLPAGCEETEVSIRICRDRTERQIMFEPGSVVHHRVSVDRTRFRYFVRRCYHEGRSKALVRALAGSRAALASERRYTTRVLPRAVMRETARGMAGQPAAFLRALAIIFGFVTTVFGYGVGSVSRPGTSG
ncbi:MAG: glycosyltransferase family 2 protein [Acidimicrobiales bacterium]